MRDHRRARMPGANRADAARGEFDMNVTVTLPQIHFSTCPLDHPGAEILIRHEKNVAISWCGAHDLLGIAARANDVGERFHSRAAIDVGDDVIIFLRMLLPKLRELLRRTGFGKRTTGVEIR